MRTAVRLYGVDRIFLEDVGGEAKLMDLVPPPDDPYFVRGPRGGLYVATGQWRRILVERGEDFMQNRMTLVDRSEGVKYVRPGSKLHSEAGA